VLEYPVQEGRGRKAGPPPPLGSCRGRQSRSTPKSPWPAAASSTRVSSPVSTARTASPTLTRLPLRPLRQAREGGRRRPDRRPRSPALPSTTERRREAGRGTARADLDEGPPSSRVAPGRGRALPARCRHRSPNVAAYRREDGGCGLVHQVFGRPAGTADGGDAGRPRRSPRAYVATTEFSARSSGSPSRAATADSPMPARR